MCWTRSPVFPHNLHRGLSLVLSMWYSTQFILIACSCAAHNNASVPTFKSPLDNHVFSLSTFLVVSLMNCPWIRFSFYFSFSYFAFCFLNSTLVIVSLVLIVSAADTPLIRSSSKLATQNPKLFSSSLMHCSTQINPLPPSFLFTHNLSSHYLGVTLHTSSFIFLIFYPNLLVHQLSIGLFLLHI